LRKRLQKSARDVVHSGVDRLIIGMVFGLLSACTAPIVQNPKGQADFTTRCADPAVVLCFGFEEEELSTHGGSIAWSITDGAAGTFVNDLAEGANLSGRLELATDQKSSGRSSLKFYMPSQTGAGFAGQFYANFSSDNSIQFGEGEQFYVQWRQRFSAEFLKNRYLPDSNWKQAIIGEGDRSGYIAGSCTQLELVVNHDNFGSPAMYHSCGLKDDRYDPIYQDWSIDYKADQWMTFQVIVKIGTWYKNDFEYHSDSFIELWVAEEGEPSRRAIRQEYDIANNNPLAKYGKVWLLPYLTGKDSLQTHPDAYTWYDELIVSKAPIADPL